MAYEAPKDYIDVATRIQEFRAKHPNGYLAPLNPAEPFKIVDINGQVFIVVVAAAYREPADTSPGVGMAWEQFPGKTPYTRNSELMNAETSAWGRAIIAVGAADSKAGIASAEEVRNRQAERQPDDGWKDYGSMAGGYSDDSPATKGSDWKPPANPHSRKAERHNSTRKGPLPDDQWTTPDPEENEAKTGTSTTEQQQQIAIHLNAKGITSREGKLAFCCRSANRTIATSAELSYLEAAEILRKADALPAVPGPLAGKR